MKHERRSDDKAIIINCMGRSGSNILWNLLQSSPDVISPGREFHQFFVSRASHRRLWRTLATTAEAMPLVRGKIHEMTRARLHRAKVDQLTHPKNKFKDRESIYTQQEADAAHLCFKVMGKDIVLNGMLENCFEETTFVGLVRNGYALCEGEMRRGVSARRAGRNYRRFVEDLMAFGTRTDRFAQIRFEDMIKEPVRTAHDLYRFCRVAPPINGEFRLKVKSTTTGKEKSIGVGVVNEKVWLSEDDLGSFFDTEIDTAQIGSLEAGDRRQFLDEAGPAMAALGYPT